MRRPPRHAPASRWRLALAALLGIILLAGSAQAEDREISARRALERKAFTDAEIAFGFFKVAFGAEMGFGGRTDRIRKYAKPVRVYVEGKVRPERRAQVTEVIADIRGRIANLDIAVTGERRDANFVVHLVRNRDLPATVRRLYGARGNRILRSLRPQCLSGFSKDAQYRITRSDVILVVDRGDFIFYDCAYEELLQALGPIRDDASVPWTMFNDNVQMGFFGIYDQYLLNILYHERVQPGMTRAELRRLLPLVMPDVRERVARANKPDPHAPEDTSARTKR
ncbi:MAG: DUF2927 domain-containing protein [Variibacter sp.]|nr:DUF2927 domain-containing protein [Variibacter sp.]